MELYNYFRSSASYRVRIALALKGLGYDYKPVHLTKNEQLGESYASVSASRLVPLLRDGEHTLTQSLAIIEYLDETHPEPPLLPKPPHERARVRALALDIACEIHPLNNLRVLTYLRRELKLDEAAVSKWYAHWIAEAFGPLETLVKKFGSERHCFGDSLSLADVCLVPQVYNARRFSCDLTPYPTLVRIADSLAAESAFARAAPDRQPDAE
jgi:maleylacetoacetate isomerase/maleylpyruvate isomerase